MNKKDFWIGIGVGTTVGLTGGFIIGNQVTKKAARRDIAKRERDAYIAGKQEGKAEAEEGVIFVDANDPKAIEKAVNEAFAKEPEKPAKNIDSKPISEANRQNMTKKDSSEPLSANPEAVYEAKSTDIPIKDKRFRVEGNHVIFIGAAGTELFYPKSLIMDDHNNLYAETKIRENFRAYENDLPKLMVLWNAMGWGTYIPAVDGPYGDQMAVTDEDIDNMDLRIDDDEPEEKTEERRKYLELLDKYRNDPLYTPEIISKKEFDDENYLEKSNFDYYDVDKAFIESSDVSREVSPGELFGILDGDKLFARKIITEDDPDPDIVYVRNIKLNFVAEITRYHKAYSDLKDGTAFVNG